MRTKCIYSNGVFKPVNDSFPFKDGEEVELTINAESLLLDRLNEVEGVLEDMELDSIKLQNRLALYWSTEIVSY